MNKRYTILLQPKKRSTAMHVLLIIIIVLVLSGTGAYIWRSFNQPNYSEDLLQRHRRQAQSYVGLSLSEARKKATKENLTVEIYKKDGKNIAQSGEYRDDRISLGIRNDIVIEAMFDDMR